MRIEEETLRRWWCVDANGSVDQLRGKLIEASSA
jgi:hypothetical protein